MKWTNQRKLSVGVLALAAGAFAVDQFAPQGGPDAAVAADAAATARPAVAATRSEPSNASAATEAAQPMAVLARHIRRVAATERLDAVPCADAFSPPAAWYPTPAPAARAAATARPAEPSSRVPEFRASYRLTAVLRTGPRVDQGMAVLHGARAGQHGVTVRVGQELGGFVLKAVHDRGVVFADGREQFELLLPEPGLVTAGAAG